MNGIELIAAERRRQIEEEGRTPEHDDGHLPDLLAVAGACYALPQDRRRFKEVRLFPRNKRTSELKKFPVQWPWHPAYWKPSPDNRIKELAKAGALIAAEIDRIQRLAPAGENGEGKHCSNCDLSTGCDKFKPSGEACDQWGQIHEH